MVGIFDKSVRLCRRHRASLLFGVEIQDAELAMEEAARRAVVSLSSHASATVGAHAVALLSLDLGLARISPGACLDLAVSVVKNETVLRSVSARRLVAAQSAATNADAIFRASGGDREQLLPKLQEMKMLTGVAIHQRGDFELAAAYQQVSLDHLGARAKTLELAEIVNLQRVNMASSLYRAGEHRSSRNLAFELLDEIDPSRRSAARILAIAKVTEHHLRDGNVAGALDASVSSFGNQEADWQFSESGRLEVSVNQIIMARDLAEARIMDGDESGLAIAYDARDRAEDLGLSDQFSKLTSIIVDAERRPRLSQHQKTRIMNVERVDTLILTVRSDELEAIRLHLGGESLGFVETFMWEIQAVDTAKGAQVVAIATMGAQGNTRSQEITSMAIDAFQPDRIVLCGIAGAIPSDEIFLGDVILPHSILDYSVGAALPGGTSEYALAPSEGLDKLATIGAASISSWSSTLVGWPGDADGLPPSAPRPSITETILTVDPHSEWGQKVTASMSRHAETGRFEGVPKAVTGVLATSNQLIKDPNVVAGWLSNARQIRAVEMEAAGVLASARQSGRPCLVVRGISDVIGVARDPAWTEYACHSSARFVSSLIRSGTFG